MRLPVPILASTAALTVGLSLGCLSQASLSGGWPDWQRIEAGEPPDAWRLEQASFAFDAWESSAVVTELSTDDAKTTIGFADTEGRELTVRMAALPRDGRDIALREGDVVYVSLISRQGFEGVARALTVRGADGRLLLLYDDGGYGPAIYEDGARGGVGVARALEGTGQGGGWVSREVTFTLAGQSVTCAEGASARLGQSGLEVAVVVSREWTGEAVTDADLSPLAYLILRMR